MGFALYKSMDQIRGNWQNKAEQIMRAISKEHGVTPLNQDLIGLSALDIKSVWREYFRLSKNVEELATSSEVAILLGTSVVEIAQQIVNLLAAVVAHKKVALHLKLREANGK